MPSRRILAVLLCALLALAVALPSPCGAAVSFTRTLLGEPGGEVGIGTVNGAGHVALVTPGPATGAGPFLWSPDRGLVPIDLPGGYDGGWPEAINDADEVLLNLPLHTFLWSPETGGRELRIDPAWFAFGHALNRLGTVALVAGERTDFGWRSPRPYLWHPDNTVTNLAAATGEPFGWPWAVNDAGQAVGGSFSVAPTDNRIPPARPFRYTPGRPAERLGRVFGTENGNAHGINRNGDAVVTLQYVPADGFSGWDYKAVLWGADGSVTEVAPPGGSRSEGRFINDRGEVSGRYVPGTGTTGIGSRAFYWSRETGPIDIGALFPHESDADGMNALGHVVGWYLAEANEWSSLRGYFWSRETGVVDLGPGRAWAINDSDFLGGYANLPNGDTQAAVWSRTGTVDPPPPPPPPAACSIPVLLAKVDALEKAGTLAKGTATSLRAKLKGALAQGAAGKGKTAANLLFAFQAEVKALVKGGRLPAADGEALAGCSSTLCTAFRAAGNGTAAKAVGRK